MFTPWNPSHPILMAAAGTPPPVATPAAPSSGAAPSGSPAAPTTPPASSTGGAPAASPSATGTDPDYAGYDSVKSLRDAYNATKARAQVLDNLGIDAADLPVAVQKYQAMNKEFNTLAAELGYDDPDDLKSAWDKDPAEALRLLRAEKQASKITQKPGESSIDFEKRIKDEVAKATKPYTDHIASQIAEQVNAKIGTETKAALDVALPNAPAEIRDIVNDYIVEFYTHPANSNHIVAMKARQDFSSVKANVDAIAARLQKAFTSWVTSERTRTGGRPAAPGAPVVGSASKRPTIDQIIEDPSLINAKYR